MDGSHRLQLGENPPHYGSEVGGSHWGRVSGGDSLVGVTGHLPKGHCGEVVVAAL